MNNLYLSGYVIKDPDVRENLSKNKTVSHFTIAVQRDFSDTADFFTLTAFNAQAAFVKKYIKKGTKVFVKAKIQNNNYEKDGIKRYDFDFIVENIELGNKVNNAR